MSLNIEKAIDNFEKNTNTLFDKSRKAIMTYNINKKHLDLLQKNENERKLMITNADKGLGPTKYNYGNK